MYERKLRYQVEPSNAKLPVTVTSNGSPRRISQRIHRSNEVLQKTPHKKLTIKPPLIENLWYVCHSYIKEYKRKLLKFLVILMGIGLVCWQIRLTVKAYIEEHTTFDVHKTTQESQVLPAILFCPMVYFDSGLFNFTDSNISDENWMFSQFYQLDDNLTLVLQRIFYNYSTSQPECIESQLTLDNDNSMSVTVEELMDPYFGICFALTLDPTIALNITDQFILYATFNTSGSAISNDSCSEEVKPPPVEVYFVNPADRYGFLFPEIAEDLEEPFKISLQAGTATSVNLQSLVWNYQTTSRRNCKIYSETDSSMNCTLKQQVDCFRENGPTRNCSCIPENLYKTHFVIHQNNSWEKCKTNEEYDICRIVMEECYYNQTDRQACPRPCKRKSYRGQTRLANGFGKVIPTNKMVMIFKFNTMDVEERNEIWIQELPFFVGSVGGSLGLFIGFSFTCIFGKIIDYSIKT